MEEGREREKRREISGINLEPLLKVCDLVGCLGLCQTIWSTY